MQTLPLNIAWILRRAERLQAKKTVATRTHEGTAVATYGQVCERTRKLVTALREIGVRPGDRVATFSWNHQQHLECYLGVPCMGAVLHTLNIRLFEKDLVFIVEHAEDKVVVVDKSLWPVWEKVAARVRCVQATIVVPDAPGPAPPGTLDYEELIAARSPVRELPEVDENEAAALCYTSGTTGNPKGVLYSHRSNYLHSLALTMADAIGISESDRVLPIVPLFHANAWGLPYACLLTGAELVFPGRHMSPQSLLECLRERRPSLAAGVPSVWTSLLEPLKQEKERGPLSLRAILCGGSAVPPALQKAYESEVGVPIVQAWGMTETSPLASLCCPLAAHRERGPEALDALRTSQGRVVPGVEIRLVGDDGKEAAWDGRSQGEIQVRGPWIASSYYKEDAREKFQDGWLRTGDVASIDGDGYMRIADRTKDLVKSGGEWISSVALEGLIMSHPSVAEAAVIGVPHPKWDERPLACVVPRPDARGRLTREEILDFLRPKVAKWWLPDDVVFLDEVPKTSVGKFDKKVLRERFKNHALPEK
ncbi:long-chain fatty acid--CoA ligase [bacterium]|nr:long-chain fatty acid--CoA ligase [bacterium]